MLNPSSPARDEPANAARTAFLGAISHEMRTPLNAILGSAELALEDLSDPAMLRAHLVRISEGATELKRLITEMLDVSKLEAGQLDVHPGPVDLRACLLGAITRAAALGERSGVRVVLACDDAVPQTVVTDADRLEHLVARMTETAVLRAHHGEVRVEVAPAGDEELEIRVAGAGPGDAGGAGEDPVGLGVARSLAQALGGTLAAGTGSTGGAELRVTLPLAAAAPRPAPPVRRQPARVLVAEDNDVNFAMFEAYLTRSGYAVERAADGAQAVAAAGACDVILMDVHMPGMDGLEATRLIRAGEAQRGAGRVPILAITAHALHEYRERCLDAGCTGFLTKPVGMRALVGAVEDALGAAA